MRDITLQEYMEMVQTEGLLLKSYNGDYLTLDSQGSSAAPIVPKDDDELEDDDEKEEEDPPTIFVQCISTTDEDRFGDILNPMGCETENFKSNPLFLYEHGMGPSGPLSNPDAILGRIRSITMSEKSITAESQYVTLETNTLPLRILNLERKSLIPGNSIGWKPLAGIKLYDNGKRYVDKWELLEVSKVLVPVNGKATNRQLAR